MKLTRWVGLIVWYISKEGSDLVHLVIRRTLSIKFKPALEKREQKVMILKFHELT